MKFKQKRIRILKIVLPLLLIVSFLSQSIVSMAIPDASTENSGNGNPTVKTDKDHADFMFNSRVGWIMSVQETAYVTNNSEYSDCAVSVVTKYLYDYPTEYVYDYFTNPEKFTYVEWTNQNSHHTSVGSCKITKQRRPRSSQGNVNSNSFANSYSSNAAAGTGHRHARPSEFATLKLNFHSTAQLLDGNASIKQGLQDRSLTGSTAISAANGSGKLDAAIKSYVALWALAGSADDAINEFIYGSSTENLDHYDILVRYLDFLIIINAMCNNAYDSYIDDFCMYQNDNFASTYVTVTIASAIAVSAGRSSYFNIMTLPNYYAARSGRSVESLLHWNGVGNGNIYDVTSATTDWSGLQNFYKSNAPDKNGSNTFAKDGNADRYWWSQSSEDWGMALTAFPEGLGGNLCGNAGYTYISTQNMDMRLLAPMHQPTPKKPKLELDFNITASSKQYMVTTDKETVDATVTIDFKQTEANLRNLKLVYDSLAADTTEDWETALEVIVQRTFEYDGENGAPNSVAWDTTDKIFDVNLNSNFKNAATLDNYNDTVIFRWEGVNWNDSSGMSAYSVFTGQQQIQFEDRGIYIDMTEKAVTNATYHCTVRFTYYPKSYTPEQRINRPTFTYNVNGTGKTKCSTGSCLSKWRWHRGEDAFKENRAAHDSVPWIYRGDAIMYYSDINPGNYAEIKHNSIYNEQYEAMAGVPTDENLFLGAGYTEFMVNMEGDIKKDTGKSRTYTLSYVVEKCAGSNADYCVRSCPGHTLKCGKCGAEKSGVKCGGISGITETCSVADCGGTMSASTSYTVADECPGETATTAAGTGTYNKADGCVVTHYLNKKHTHVHTYKAVIEQEISDYHYLDVDNNLEVWQVNEIEYKADDDVIGSGNEKILPETTVRSFFKEGSYKSGNGRLIFSSSKSGEDYLGNDKYEVKTGTGDGDVKLVTEAPEPFAKLINEYINGTVKDTVAVVMSDYLDLKNTEGSYQVITGNAYASLKANVPTAGYTKSDISESETKDSDGKEKIGDPSGKTYTFNKITYKKGEAGGLNFAAANSTASPWGDSLENARARLWGGDATDAGTIASGNFTSYTFHDRSSSDLFRVGYTGEYANRSSNYSNTNYTSGANSLMEKTVFGSSATYAERLKSVIGVSALSGKTGQSAYEVTGLNIRDSYEKKTGADSNIYRPNEITDSRAPVENGVHSVGNVYLHAKKSIGSGNHDTKGTDWGVKDGNKVRNDNNSYDIEMVYTEGKTKVNDIVVFDPVATSGEVLSIAAKYDQRVDGQAPKGTRPALSLGYCPGDYTCEFKTLTDYAAHPKDADGNVFSQHNDNCYVQVSGDFYQHLQDDGTQGPKGVYNYHEHDDDECYSNYEAKLEVDRSKIKSKTDTDKLSAKGEYLLAGGVTYYIEIAGPSTGHYKYNRYKDRDGYQDYLNYPGTVIKGFITLDGDPDSADDVYTLSYETSLMGMNSSDIQWANTELTNAWKKAVRGTQKFKLYVPDLKKIAVGAEMAIVQANRNAMVEAATDTTVRISKVEVSGKGDEEKAEEHVVLDVTAAKGRGTPVPNWFRDVLEPYESEVSGTIKNQQVSYDNDGDGYIYIVAVSDEKYGDKYGQYGVEDMVYDKNAAYDSKTTEVYTHGIYLWNWNLNTTTDGKGNTKPVTSVSVGNFPYYFHCSSAEADDTYHYPLDETQQFVNGKKNFNYEPFVYAWLQNYSLYGEDEDEEAEGEEVEDPNEAESATEEPDDGGEEPGDEESGEDVSSGENPGGDGSDVIIDDSDYNAQSTSKNTVDVAFYHINDKGKVAGLNSGNDRIEKVKLLYNLNFYTYDSSKGKYVQAKYVNEDGKIKNATMTTLGYKALQDSVYEKFYVRLGFGSKGYVLFSDFVEEYKDSLCMKILPTDVENWSNRKNITKSDYFCEHVRGKLYYTARDSRFWYDGNSLFDWNVDHTKPNRHTCTDACTGYKSSKVLSCTEPHHYTLASLMGAWTSYLPAGVSITSCTENQRNEAIRRYFENNASYYNDASHHGTECWIACGDDSKHTLSSEEKKAAYEKEVSDNGNTVAIRRKYIAFVGLDREFKVKYPTTGDFYSNNALGLLDTVGVLGKGYANGMSTERWIRDKYVTFSFDVLVENSDYSGGDPEQLGAYVAYAAGTPIPWYTYFKGKDTGTFYIPLENSEQIDGTAQFQVIAVNGARKGITKENENEDNHVCETYNYKRKHDAYLLQYVDVIGSIGALSITDTGDPRFAALFKKVSAENTNDNVNYSTDLNDWLIPGLVPAVDSESPRKIVSDKKTAKNEDSISSAYQDSWDSLTPGEISDGTFKNGSNVPENPVNEYGGKWKDGLLLPLTPEYLSEISSGLTNQAMRVGYGLYMDVQTVGNYYGRNYTESTEQQVAIKPNYTLVVPREKNASGEVTRYNTYHLDVYAANSMGEYSLVNYYSDIKGSVSNTGLKAGNIYLDWITESGRRNATNYERYVTGLGDKQFVTITDESLITQDPDTGEVVIPDAAYSVSGRSVTTSEMHKIGTTQLLNLIDLDKTYLGTMYTTDRTGRSGVSSFTDSELMNGNIGDEDGNAADDTYLVPVGYTKQAQRYHFSVKLPSSSKFVLAGKPYNKANLDEYESLADEEGAHIILTLDIEADGQVWDLEYKGVPAKYTYKGLTFDPGTDPDPDPGHNPDPDPNPDPGPDPVIVIYDPKKTSKDDLDTFGTH